MAPTERTDDSDGTRRFAGALRRVPMIVWWITALHVGLLLAYSILLPTYRAPDEPQHVDLARVVSEDLRYPAWDDRDLSPGVERSFPLVDFSDGSRHLTTDAALPKDQRPSIDDLEEPPRPTSVNQLPQHPPLYYLVAGGAERLVEVATGDPSFDLETWLYRLVSVLCVAPLPLIIWHVSRLLRTPTAVGVAATLVPLAVPQLTHIGSAVNNDNLMLLAFWLLTPVVLRLAGGDLRPRTGVLAGVITGVGLLTKGFAMVMPLWVLAGLVVALRRGGRARLQAAVGAGAVCGLCALAVGGWWWLRNLVLYGQIAPSRFDELLPPSDDVNVRWGNFFQAWAYRTTRRFWGDFGWFDVALPTLAFAAASVVCVVGLAMACARRDRVAETPVGDRLLLAAPLLLLVVLQLAVALNGYLETGQMPGMQGRYWFGALAGIAVVVALGLANLRPSSVRLLPLALFTGAAAMQGVAVWTLVHHYWGAPTGTPLTDRFRAVVAWAPLPGEVIGVGAVMAGIVGVGTLVQVTGLALRGGSADLVPSLPVEDAPDGRRARITVVGPVPPFCSGPAQHAGLLAEALVARCDVTVLSWQHQYPKLLFRHAQRDPSARPHPGARFQLRWWDPISWWRAGRVARKGDVVVITWVTPFHAVPYWVLMWAASPARKVALVHNAIPHEKLPLQKPLTRWVLGRCDGLVAHSAAVASDLADLVPDVELIATPMPPLIRVQPQPLPEGTGDDLKLLFFGFVRPYKGVDVALDALRVLGERGFRPRLTVAGELWEPIEPWYRRIEERGLTDQVDLRPRYVSDAEVNDLLAAHHAVLLPYRSATQSGVVPVAMAAGRPVIATNVGGLAEAVSEGVNGALAEPGDARSLADAIQRCTDQLDELAANTKSCVASWDDVADVLFKAAGLTIHPRS